MLNMKHSLRISFIALLAMLFGHIQAAEVTINFNAMNVGTSSGSGDNYVSDGDINETWTYSLDGVTIAVSPKDEEAKNPNRFWGTNNGPQLRCYSGTITISAAEAITKIEFAKNASNFDLTPSSGTLDGTVWTGSANEVVFTVNKNTQLNSITVTLGGGGTVDPPQGETVNIAGFKALNKGDEATLKLDNAQVLFAKGNDIFVRDASGAIDFFKTELGYETNQMLNGTVKGKLDIFNNMPELVVGENFEANVTATSGSAAKPVVVTIAQANMDYACDLITINGLTLRQDGNNWYGDANGASIQVYDKFRLGYTPEEGKTYNITGILVPYKENFEICPIVDFTSGVTPPPPPVGDKKVFRKATTIESGKQYLIAANTQDKEYAIAKPITSNYGYLNVDLQNLSDETLIQDNLDNAFVITKVNDGYTIQQSDGRYLYQKGNYNSFNVDAAPEEGQVWGITIGGNDLVTIVNINVQKYVQYSTQYSSYGSYSDERGLLPTLFVLDDTNAINTITTSRQTSSRYNLAGQRVNDSYHGIVIQNGRKVVK